ncbi:hypothetical protein HZH66_010014 [Vespula vulgaris]|uniref:Uncharacterized protein n=1 Tax=Vespula vulgaris TaxID=7454 RepID=A0A834MXM0_VESVU|nr:hypothetical protein HZH66_010014 [Vespula vulgaris]
MGDGVDVGGSGRGGGGGDGDGVERVVVGNAQAVSLGHLLEDAYTKPRPSKEFRNKGERRALLSGLVMSDVLGWEKEMEKVKCVRTRKKGVRRGDVSGLGLGLGLDADAERFVVYVGSQTETQMKGGKEEDKQWYGGESKNG